MCAQREAAWSTEVPGIVISDIPAIDLTITRQAVVQKSLIFNTLVGRSNSWVTTF